MPAAIPFIVAAGASAAGATLATVVVIGAVTGAFVAFATGENVLKGALMGALAGWGASAMFAAAPAAASAEAAAGAAAEGAAGAGATGAAEVAATGVPAATASTAASGAVQAGVAEGATAGAYSEVAGEVFAQGAANAAPGANAGLLAGSVKNAGLSNAPTAGGAPAAGGTGTTTATPGTGLLNWIDKNPGAANMGAQAIGNGLTGMAQGSAAQAQLDEARRRENLRLSNAAGGTAPRTTYQSGLLNNGMQLKPV